MFQYFLSVLNQNLTVFVIVPIIFLAGVYLTIKLKYIQITKLKLGVHHLFMKEEREKGSISNFQAISSVLAGNLGTGNISGMAVALTLGGPGSLIWMWVMAFLGSVIKYVGCYLGFKYRVRNKEGEYVGGPMYYLKNGLNSKFVAILFSVFCLLTALTVGNFVQVNSVVLPLEQIGINPILLGVTLAVIVGIVVLGGTLRFARVAEVVVPFMAVLYFFSATYILVIHADKIIPAISVIVSASVKPIAITSGAIGYGFFYALSSGFSRGVFATDAGVGIAPILQSGAREKKPVLEGCVAMTAPLFVMIICSMTVLVLMVTDAWQVSGMESTNMCAWAFEKGMDTKVGGYIIMVSLLFFAFTTIMAWSTAAGKAAEFLFGLKGEKIFEYIFIVMIPLGAVLESQLIWMIADVSMAFMLITNLIGVCGLSKKVIKDTLAFKVDKS
jgi:alanine or glycine:cation symporter, AGCS family